MAEIKNIETLHAEISRLKNEINSREQRMRQQVIYFRESMKPANLVSSGFRNITGEHDKHFIREATKTGLLPLIGKVFFNPGEKAEQRLVHLVDMTFDKVKYFFERRRNKKKENPFYNFEDKYESESN